MNNFIKLWPWLFCTGLAQSQAAEPLKVQAASFVRLKIGTNIDLQVSIEGFDKLGEVAPCQNPEFFIPGQMTVERGFVRMGVRCNKPSTWVVYGIANITKAQTISNLKADLPAGHVITANDLTTAKVFNNTGSAGASTVTTQLIGRTLVTALPAGSSLQYNQTKPNWVIKGGQTVTLLSQGQAFRISSEGQATGNAVAGQTLQVRTATGKVLTGQALPTGDVELAR